MALDLPLCNQALSLIGARSTILDPAEISTEANNCRLFFDEARQMTLRLNDWAFARKQVALAVLPSPIAPYLFKYTYPADCVQFRRIIPTPGAPPMAKGLRRRFTIQIDGASKVISSNVPNAIGIYTFDVQDKSLWDSMFIDAYPYVLGSKLSMPCTGNVMLVDKMMNAAYAMIGNATSGDANEANTPKAPMQQVSLGAQADGNKPA